MSVGFLKKRARGKKYRKNMSEAEKASSAEVFQEIKRIVINEKIHAYRERDKAPLGASCSAAAKRLKCELSLIANEIPEYFLDIEAMNKADMLEIDRWVQISSGKGSNAIDSIKTLMSFISPDQNNEKFFLYDDDSASRLCPELDSLIPENSGHPYDMRAIITAIVDKGVIFKAPSSCTASMIICFARIGGHSVGIIANQPFFPSSLIDSGIADKAAKFIRFCDTFDIPVISITEAPGFLSGYGHDWDENIRHGAKLLWSYSAATVPKILLITKKSWSEENVPFSSKHLGADTVFAWPTQNIKAVTDVNGNGAAGLKAVEASVKKPRRHKQKIQSIEFLFSKSKASEHSGFRETVIRPSETRIEIASALASLLHTKAQRKDKKSSWDSGWAELEKSEKPCLSELSGSGIQTGYRAVTK